MLETTELLGQIVRLCAEQKTGTLFLTTTENKACHIVFDNGRIVAMAYGNIRGVAVADILPRMPIQASQFNSALTMPLSSKAALDNDHTVFDKLGLRRTASVAMPSSSSQRMYRGHAVSENTSMQAEKPKQAATLDKPRKSKRIYRGQVIED